MKIVIQNQEDRRPPLLIRWLVSAFALWVADWMIEGIVIDEFQYALLAAAVIGITNSILKPILTFLALPFILITFGLFLFVINAVLLLLASDLIPHFHVIDFWSALWGSMVISVVTWLVNSNLPRRQNPN